MTKFLATLFISFLTALFGVSLIYNFVPLDFFEFGQKQQVGSTITTILGTDTLSSSRLVINSNFSNLNTDKFELSSWYATTSATQLTTFGTITTGVWNGTAIGVAYGGTGTTSPSTNYVMLGNGSSGFKVVGGFGTSGQFLTSNGASAAPSWQSGSFDTAANFTVTGDWIFSRATTTHATTTGSFNIPYVTSSLLKTDSLGKVVAATAGTDYARPQYTFATTTDTVIVNSNINTSGITIPANIMTASSTIEVRVAGQCVNSSGGGDCTFTLEDGSGTNFITDTVSAPESGATQQLTSDVRVLANNSTSAQVTTMRSLAFRTGTINNVEAIDVNQDEETSTINTSNALTIRGNIAASANTTFTLFNMTIIVNP